LLSVIKGSVFQFIYSSLSISLFSVERPHWNQRE
jgi:hypothetical protein